MYVCINRHIHWFTTMKCKDTKLRLTAQCKWYYIHIHIMYMVLIFPQKSGSSKQSFVSPFWSIYRRFHLYLSKEFRYVRFNQEVDVMTGYRTRSIMCCPIKVTNIKFTLKPRLPFNQGYSLSKVVTLQSRLPFK